MAQIRRPLARPALAALLVGTLALTGCGLLTKKPTGTPTAAPTTQAAPADTPSAEPSASSDTPLDPCTLITDNDVSVSSGKPVAKHFPANNGPIVSCEWTLDPAFLIVRVTLAPTTKEAFDSAQKLDSSAKPISGLGDAAYLGGDVDLRVLKGTYLLTIKYSETSKPDLQLSVEKSVANKVLPKLP
jgi:hypothetical protein